MILGCFACITRHPTCSKFIQEAVKLLEIDRVQLKFQNLMATKFLEEHQVISKQINDALKAEKANEEESIRSDPETGLLSPRVNLANADEDPTILLFKKILIVVKECQCFTVLMLWKRWRLVIELLNMVADDTNLDQFTMLYVQFLLGGFWWYYRTVRTILEQSEKYQHLNIFTSIS